MSERKWVRDEFDKQKWHYVDHLGRNIQTIWKSGTKWWSLTGESFITKRIAMQSMEAWARDRDRMDGEQVQTLEDFSLAPGNLQQDSKASNSHPAQHDFDALKAIGQSVMQTMNRDGFRYDDPVELGDEVVLRLLSLKLPEKDREFIGNFIFAQHGHGGGLRCSKKPFKAFSERNALQTVQLSALSLTFSLPHDFGRGWDYRNVILYGASHTWSGSYDREENANFAHEALHRVAGLDSSSLYVGMSCTVTFNVGSLAEATEIRERLQRVVDAFPVRPERSIAVRGSHYWNARVTEYATDDADVASVSDMPLRAYLAQFVPLASEHPAISGDDLKKVVEEYA